MNTLLTIIYLLGIPLLVMRLAKRWSWIEKVSPMTVLYLIGLAVANLIPPQTHWPATLPFHWPYR